MPDLSGESLGRRDLMRRVGRLDQAAVFGENLVLRRRVEARVGESRGSTTG